MTGLAFSAEAVASQEAQIRSFAQLPNGWHYGEGRGATDKAVATAVGANSLLLMHGAHDVEAFPDVEGGILLSGYHGDHTLEILCDPSGRMDMLHEANDEVVKDRGRVSLEEVDAYIRGLEWTPKNLFVYFIQCTSASERDASRVWLSSHPPVEGYRSSTPGALWTIAAENVPISVGTIKASPDTPMFSGESIQVFSRGVAGSHVNLRRPGTPATGISTVSHKVPVDA